VANAETNLQGRIMIALSEAGCLIWRNNVGGTRAPDGRIIRYGVGGKGASDLMGIAPDGRFLAVEVKTPTGRVSDAQAMFIDAVRARGGRAGIARNPDDAVEIACGPAPVVT
jgi:hypothetical protein